MVEDDPSPECTDCAACCFSDSARHARVTGDDYRRLGDDAEGLVEWIGNLAFMRLDSVTADLKKCIALRIDTARGTFACSIYETRPYVCRELERGSGGCHGELATKADRPRRALAVLRASRVT